MTTPKWMQGTPVEQPAETPKWMQGAAVEQPNEAVPDTKASEWKDSGYGFKVKDAVAFNGKPTVEREDGFQWLGPEQGNTGKPGWFDAKGNRGGSVPGKPAGPVDQIINTQQERRRNPVGAAVSGLGNTSLIPGIGGLQAAGLDPFALMPENFRKNVPEPTYAGSVKGAVDPAVSLVQIGSHMVNPAGTRTSVDRGVDAIDQFYKGNFQESKSGELMGQAVPFVMGGGAAQGATKVAQNAGKVKAAMQYLGTVGKGTATGAALAPLMTPETGVQEGENFWIDRKLPKAKVGALTGGLISAAAPIAGKAVDVLTRQLTPEQKALQDLADKFGIRVMAPDMTTSPVMNKTAVLMESVPGAGMVAQRQAQQAEARLAAEKLLAQHGIQTEVPGTIQKSLQNNLGQVKGRVRSAYDAVAKAAEGSGNVPLDQTMQAIQKARIAEEAAAIPDAGLVGLLKKMESRLLPKSMKIQMSEYGQGVEPTPDGMVRLYRAESPTVKFGDIFNASGLDDFNTNMPGVRFTDNIGTAKYYHHAYNGNKDAKLFYVDIPKNDIGKFRVNSEEFQIPVGGDLQIPSTVDTSYTGVRGLRSDLGSMISDYYKGTNATTGSKGVQVLQGIKEAVQNDLKAFTDAQGGDIAKLARQADELYSKQLVPLKDRVIVQATKNSEPDQIYRSVVGAGKDRAQKFYDALTPEGQAAVRSQMVKDAFENATKKEGTFSPAQFAKSLEDINDSTGVFFKGKDKFEMDGFVNLMRHIQRAGQIGENPPTGARLVQGLIMGEGFGAVTGAAMGHPGAVVPLLASSATSRTLTKLFSSPTGKRILLGASSMKPGSAAMQNLIEKDLSRFAGAENARNVVKFNPTAPVEAPAKIAQTEPTE